MQFFPTPVSHWAKQLDASSNLSEPRQTALRDSGRSRKPCTTHREIDKHRTDMSQAGAEQALQVCKTCKTRKKRCDKQVPICGYCKARNLACKYDADIFTASKPISLSSQAKWRQWTPQNMTSGKAGTGSDKETIPAPAMTLPYGFPSAEKGTRLDKVLWTHLLEITSLLDLSLDEMVDRYFNGVHTWLPLISPPTFREKFRDVRDRIPLPEFSVLLLTMCLITLRPPLHSSRASSIGWDSIYKTTKTTFAQVQIMSTISTMIIQANTLIAAYEYACGRLQEAYLSIGTSSRMCHILGFDQHRCQLNATMAELETLEARNTWWSTLILER